MFFETLESRQLMSATLLSGAAVVEAPLRTGGVVVSLASQSEQRSDSSQTSKQSSEQSLTDGTDSTESSLFKAAKKKATKKK